MAKNQNYNILSINFINEKTMSNEIECEVILIKNNIGVLIMNRKKNSIIKIIAIYFSGIVLTLNGAAGLFSFIDTKNYIHTVGVVEECDRRKRLYKSGETRYEKTMVISYEADKYGTLYATIRSYYPFRKVGDELTLWYDPDDPSNIKLPFSDGISFILSIVIGSLIIHFGLHIVNKNR